MRRTLVLLTTVLVVGLVGCAETERGVNKNLDRPTNRASLNEKGR